MFRRQRRADGRSGMSRALHDPGLRRERGKRFQWSVTVLERSRPVAASRTGTGIRFRRFLGDLTKLCDAGADEGTIRARASASLHDLVSADDWLPAEFAKPDPANYRRYLLYCDPLNGSRWSASSGGPASIPQSTTTPCG